MNLSTREHRFELPNDLRRRLHAFQRSVWKIKTAEGVLAALVGLAASYVLVFVLDRFGETPGWLRLVVLVAGLAGAVLFLPLKIRRWVWGSRRLQDVARLLSYKHPSVGDRLLGIVELSQATRATDASPALCRAAIEQVAADTRNYDFRGSVPTPRHQRWGVAAAISGLLAVIALSIPGAGWNALQRWANPFGTTARYTFAQIQVPSSRLVVPIGEPFAFDVTLDDATAWEPGSATARYGNQPTVTAQLSQRGYRFQLPAQKSAATMKLVVGDCKHWIDVVPSTRPELTAMTAQVRMPAYIGHPDQQKDARSGAVSILKGSQAKFEARASRNLASAAVDGSSDGVELSEEKIKTDPYLVNESNAHEFTWTDVEGLSAKQPFRLKIRSIDDEAPILLCRDLMMEQVVLDEEVLSFGVAAEDDFGVRRVGVQWSEVEDALLNPEPDMGEYDLAHGGQQDAEVEATGTFCAKQLNIEPQPIHVRIFAEDYLPGRDRVYSPVYRLYVLNAEQHMIWLTEKLKNWERRALEVRDEEERLFQRNRELRDLSAEERATAETRKEISRQSAAERANGRRLARLTASGDDLLKQATRNRQFNVETLEKWARTLQALKGIASNRMPSVANLLGEAAVDPNAKGGAPSKVPGLVDLERGIRPDPDAEQKEAGEQASDDESAGGGRFGLPDTIIPDSTPSEPAEDEQPQPQDDSKLDEAVAEQRKLLEEFNNVMDELAEVLKDLFGSTFVKRLKHAARQELQLASRLHGKLESSFGVKKSSLAEAELNLLQGLYDQQTATAEDVMLIQEDLAAYFQRTEEQQFQVVHDQMAQSQVVGSFRQLALNVTDNISGQSIAEAEYWADELDRWADILVGPG